MKIEEIKRHQDQIGKICEQAAYGDEPDKQRELIAGQCYWLAEIALQIASLNQVIASMYDEHDRAIRTRKTRL